MAGGRGWDPLPSSPPRARLATGGSRAGRGRRLEAPPRRRSGGRAGGRRGWGRGGRAGAGVSLPPSLSPVKSRGAAGLSPVSSSCSLGRAAVTVHRRRRGLHRRVRPPASMATTATCTRFTDDYQLFEELGKYGRPPPPRPPTLPPPPGRYAAPRPAPGPAPVAAAPPRPAPPPAFPARRLWGPLTPRSLSRSPLRSLQQLPGLLHPALPRGPQPPDRSWAPSSPAPPTPFRRPSSRPRRLAVPSPPCSGAHPAPCPMHVRRAWHSGPSRPCSSKPAAVPGCGGMFGARPRPPLVRFQDPSPRPGRAAAPPSPPPTPAVVPGAARRSRSIPLPSAPSWPPQRPRPPPPPHPHPRRRARPLQPPPRPPP